MENFKNFEQYIVQVVDYITPSYFTPDHENLPKIDAIELAGKFKNLFGANCAYWRINEQPNKPNMLSLHMLTYSQGDDLVYVDMRFDSSSIAIVFGCSNESGRPKTEHISYRDAWLNVNELTAKLRAILNQAVRKANSITAVPIVVS